MIKFLKNALSTRKMLQQSLPPGVARELTDEELKGLQGCFLEMLKDIDKVCTEHGICYMAAGGTALGSVRHKGFIPWDDDVDILMPHKDLKKFIRIFEKTMGDRYEMTAPNSPYPLESMISAIYRKNTLKASFGTYNAPFPKGVHVDIFPIEAVPMNPVLRFFKGYTAMMLQYIAVSSLFYHYRNKDKKAYFYQSSAGRLNYRLRCLIGFLFSFRHYEKWGNAFDRFVQWKHRSDLWTVPTDMRHYFGHIMPKDVYFPPIRGQFEDFMICLPHNTDEYLKNQYGDYMKIPPESEREKHYSVGFSLDLAAEEGQKHE